MSTRLHRRYEELTEKEKTKVDAFLARSQRRPFLCAGEGIDLSAGISRPRANPAPRTAMP
jgi:hypothetical protein